MVYLLNIQNDLAWTGVTRDAGCREEKEGPGTGSIIVNQC